MFDRFIPMVVPTYVIEEIRLEKKDIIVFCSDGVSDYVPLSYIRDVVSEEDLFGSIKTVIILYIQKRFMNKSTATILEG